jgi:inorganic triphosphatase YgiF
VLEREAKLAAPPGLVLPDLGPGAVDHGTRRLDATYWDTRDLRLARDGITLRHRVGEGADRWTLKLPSSAAPGPGLARTEDDVPGDPGEPPAELATRVRAWVRTSRLEPVGRLVTTRRAVVVDGAVEVVDDDVAVLDGDREVGRFREIEAELVGAAPADLLPALVDRLVAAGADAADPVPKLVRALGDRAAAPPELAPVEVPEDPLVADVVAGALVEAVREVRAGDLLVTGGAVEDGVLTVRRGLRRTRSALRALSPALDREVAEPLRDAAAWAVEALTPARLAERVSAVVAEVAGGELAARASAERADAATTSAAALDGDRWLRLLDELVAAAADPPLAPDAGADAAEVLPRVVAGAWAELTAAVGDRPAGEPPDEVRRLVTAARDASELAVAAAGDPAAALAGALGRLRRVLGDHRDARLAAWWLAAAGADPAPAEQLAARAASRWPAAWAEAAERAAWLA